MKATDFLVSRIFAFVSETPVNILLRKHLRQTVVAIYGLLLMVEKTKKTPQQKLHANIFYGSDRQEDIVISLLSKYLSKREMTYYMSVINREARLSQDTYTQVIQVILEKEKQPKFSKAKKQYKRNNII